ncbi:MAG: helix-turn-helix domain-containing protein [Gemmatimonadaceae bacterium]
MRATILRTLADLTLVHISPDVDDLAEAVEGHNSSVVVVEIRDKSGGSRIPLIDTLHHRFGSTIIVACARVTRSSSSDLTDAFSAGATACVFHGTDDINHVLRSTVAKVQQKDSAHIAAEVMRRLIAPDAFAIVQPLLDCSFRGDTVAEIAAGLHVSVRTFSERFRAASLPAPKALMTCARLLVAGHLLQYSQRSLPEIAARAGFASSRQLRRALRNYTGLRRSNLRQSAFLSILQELKRYLFEPLPRLAVHASKTR